jgi:hypothetical protein
MLTLEILIPTVWLAVIAFVVALCRLSARSDRGPKARPTTPAWIEIGALGLRGGAPEIRASGRSERGETPELLVRELSGI